MFSNEFMIGNRRVSLNSPPYFIAEIGSNFDGSLSRAKELIYLAKESGAHAAKFQHYSAESLVSDHGFSALGQHFGHQNKWSDSVFNVYDKASLDRSWTHELADTCRLAGIDFMTSPYSLDLVDYVDKYVPAFKIGSGDITWIDAISYAAKKNKPILLATGASDIEDVKRAMSVILPHNKEVVLMQCNTNYAADLKDLKYQNLRVLQAYRSMFPNVILGLSDHTKGNTAVLASYVLGARVFEKHFTDDTTRSGPDHAFATTANEFQDMVNKVSELEEVLGVQDKKIEPNELETVIVQRRSIHASRNIDAGEILQLTDFVFLRPCPVGALPPYLASTVTGRRAKVSFKKGETITQSNIE